MEILLILPLALVIDLVLGEPPTIWHPVGWMGKLIDLLKRFAPRGAAVMQFLYGTGMVLLGLALFSAPAYFIPACLEGFNRVACIIGSAALLKSTFSIRELRHSALEIKRLLSNNDLQKGAGSDPSERGQTPMQALVSRNTEGLSSSLLVAATVESVAENTSDSLVAPLFYFLLFGVPGAIAYRVVNTFDSMIGYRGEYEYLGKFAARLDDVLNFIPARLTGLMMVFAALLSGKSGAGAWQTMLRDHAKVESPNAGWPMSAAAGALGVRLEKVGHYKLGEANSMPTLEKIDSVLLLMYLVVSIWVVVCFSISGVRFVAAS